MSVNSNVDHYKALIYSTSDITSDAI